MAKRTYHPRGVLVDGFAARQHPLYTTWANMLARCYNPDAAGWENYGGRGIRVEPRWHHFANFAADVGPKPDPALTIERKDNSAGYGPGNCIWATRSDQCVNRRKFRNNTTGHSGVVKCGNRFSARFDYEGRRYRLGRFGTAGQAAAAREAFVGLFFADRAAALEMLAGETVWCSSSTGLRGITPHADGGYIVRVTQNGERKYLGYFKNLDEAVAAKAGAQDG